jgi:hypothetical protein
VRPEPTPQRGEPRSSARQTAIPTTPRGSQREPASFRRGLNGSRHQSGVPAGVLAGTIERVTFHNAENGFCVLRVKARGRRDLITVVGHAASISTGEWVTATGEWVKASAR